MEFFGLKCYLINMYENYRWKYLHMVHDGVGLDAPNWFNIHVVIRVGNGKETSSWCDHQLNLRMLIGPKPKIHPQKIPTTNR